jgi:hypothetical protein
MLRRPNPCGGFSDRAGGPNDQNVLGAGHRDQPVNPSRCAIIESKPGSTMRLNFAK